MAAESQSKKDAEYWFRRYMTQLSIANGAGLVLCVHLIASVGAISDKLSLYLFATGTLLASAYPLVRWVFLEHFAEDSPPHTDFSGLDHGGPVKTYPSIRRLKVLQALTWVWLALPSALFLFAGFLLISTL
jgi:hypothetical protein